MLPVCSTVAAAPNGAVCTHGQAVHVHLCWSLYVSFHKLIPPLIFNLVHSHQLFLSPAGPSTKPDVFGLGKRRGGRGGHGAGVEDQTKAELEAQHNIFTEVLQTLQGSNFIPPSTLVKMGCSCVCLLF